MNNNSCANCGRKNSGWCSLCFYHPLTYTSANSVRTQNNWIKEK